MIASGFRISNLNIDIVAALSIWASAYLMKMISVVTNKRLRRFASKLFSSMSVTSFLMRKKGSSSKGSASNCFPYLRLRKVMRCWPLWFEDGHYLFGGLWGFGYRNSYIQIGHETLLVRTNVWVGRLEICPLIVADVFYFRSMPWSTEGSEDSESTHANLLSHQMFIFGSTSRARSRVPK
jgi:hypothetical protein